MSSALAAFGKSARHAVDEANRLSDLDMADLFAEICAALRSGCGPSNAYNSSDRAAISREKHSAAEAEGRLWRGSEHCLPWR